MTDKLSDVGNRLDEMVADAIGATKAEQINRLPLIIMLEPITGPLVSPYEPPIWPDWFEEPAMPELPHLIDDRLLCEIVLFIAGCWLFAHFILP